MLVVIAERIDDVRHDVDAAHAQHVVSLSPDDAGRTCGYATVHVASPTARLGGVAVVAGDHGLLGTPDPVRILVRDAGGPDPVGATLVLRRVALPLLLRADPV